MRALKIGVQSDTATQCPPPEAPTETTKSGWKLSLSSQMEGIPGKQ